MGAVLEWLQTMLVQLELGGTEELDGPLPEMEDDELDDALNLVDRSDGLLVVVDKLAVDTHNCVTCDGTTRRT